MIDIEVLEKNIKQKNFDNGYIFIGLDEGLIKETVENIIGKVVEPSFEQLNVTRLDGNKLNFDSFMNACETLPFVSEKKVVLVYRASFLGDKEDRESKKNFDLLLKYLEDLPEHCVVILYYIFKDDREKPVSNLKKLEKKLTVVKVDRLKGDKFYKRVETMFQSLGKDIEKTELRFFCDNTDSDMRSVENEVVKLVYYCKDRKITKEDIKNLLPPKNDDDIFNLVDFVSQKRPEKAIDVLNELLFKGENIQNILYMIVRQFNLLYKIKSGIEIGGTKESITKELKLHPYVCEKLINQCRKFTMRQIKESLRLCMDTERAMKSTQLDKKIEMEMLIVGSVRVG